MPEKAVTKGIKKRRAFRKDCLWYLQIFVEDATEATPCSVFYEKNPALAMLYCGMTEKTKEKFAGSLITFLDNSNNA